ncbi:class 1a ribonucleoside-diphosphate reductase subunit alpha [Photobacterium phosphoreum]|jgi:ribonucleoside-diphosphate reductase alpha chain|uniref:class 1a ribonucleoside-diphosphate reductase subunit alpha n=1 Tax=Photobacterium phosphoreum TaxID=659 RepID=UPI0007F91CAE|nr:class 1a ribonucleoside-diphosphate reductase subunit alpha [Photobacterium phosphoreum]MCD9461669.1 ribonucleoside-diphosphate reductase subunit alpha [Photobacterium phosphoreum]MCD9469778.1 ribonucleoside-diphosphate reductase subunit alpha [Photobacterium phosphoreum]MCD9478710.1 ribonucleoside-diphosphate reductase subunit alpha [Photobacterium phosphoreum]MCD9483716.1 ribonucleoside-diphosphate reductase subunit alpha [Photobacterium phosphoreum]MCD9500900.1 ribonucleoside-diphosphate
MTQQLTVTKRNGRKELIDLDKIHRVIDWAAEGLENVSVSQVELKSHIQFYDGIRTDDIHETIIKAAADLISEETPDYQYLAARLAIFHLRKKAYGQFEPPALYDHVKNLVEKGKYDSHLLDDYTKEEFAVMDTFIDHWRDMNFSYAAVKQLEGKYLVQNRVSGEIFESAQFLYLLIAAALFNKYPKETRLDYIKRFYDASSTFKISLPTPIMSGVRTPTRQFSSCVLIECDDSLDSINATASSIVRYVSQRAGIGINAGRIRALGSEIRGGEAFHTGCIPFYKYFQTAVKCCSQGGVRGGAATLFYPIWHREVESLLVLKNNRGVEENRVRHMDYGVQINRLMYTRLIKGQNISLFSPSDVPGLYDSFFADQVEFERLYNLYEQDDSIKKQSIKAIELFSLLMQERASTGRIYIQNVDHCNTHSPFDPAVAPIRQSNLCLEIALPTKPLKNVEDENGEIALCTLSAFNLGAIDTLDDLEELAELTVRALDALLDYQDYPLPAARRSTMNRRTLGVGVINFAYYLAKHGVRYSDGSANNLTHEAFEAIQYYLLKASVNLAKEYGACPSFNETTYSQGILPIDTYKKEIDNICNAELRYDWETLREEIKTHGLRNSTLTALMPSETSSQISNATNGIEPPRGYVSVKASKDGILKQVVPEFAKYKDNYELLWNIGSNDGYLQLVGIMQKFIDQAISANTNYDPSKQPGGRIPMKLLLKDLLHAYKLGIKTLYYHNTRDGASDSQSDLSGDDCTSCKI